MKFLPPSPPPASPPLVSSSKPLSKPKTFASVLKNSDDFGVNLSQLPSPTLRGDVIFVKINEDIYQHQLDKCKKSLLGRLLLRKGSKPMKLDQLRPALQSLWNPTMDWHIMPLPKGFYHILFSFEEDLPRVWGGGTCTLPQPRAFQTLSMAGNLPSLYNPNSNALSSMDTVVWNQCRVLAPSVVNGDVEACRNSFAIRSHDQRGKVWILCTGLV